MKDYLLIFRDHEQQWGNFSPSEIQTMIESFDAWRAEISSQNAFIGAGKLSGEPGVTVREKDGEVLVDGPFCEAKEAVSGYYCIRASSQVDAIEIAKKFPMLAHGGSVEVRELAVLQSS